MSKHKQNRKGVVLPLIVVTAVLAVAALLLLRLLPDAHGKQPVHLQPTQTQPSATGTAETTPPEQTEPMWEEPEYKLDNGLCITDSGRYTGMYVEDGTNELVEDVMMLVVQNRGEKDIQLAEITAVCGGEEYRFTLTNLAVGERAVLLEQERKPAAELTAAVLNVCATFSTPMELHRDKIEISGLDGMLNVKNISGSDIDGDICVYYKYAAEDLYYGGITFRVRIEGGLTDGELRQIPAGHYAPESCAIVQVTIYG